MSEAAALRRARRMLRDRAGRPDLRETLFRVYAAVIVAIVVVFPVVRAVFIFLSVPAGIEFLAESVGAEIWSIVFAGATVVLAATARVRGPVVPAQPYLMTVVGSPLARALTLRRPFLQSTALVLAVVLALGGLYLGVALVAGIPTPAEAVLFAVGVLVGGAALAVVWAGAQSPYRRIVVSVVTAAAVVQIAVALLSPAVAAWITPWGWSGTLWAAVHATDAVGAVLALGLLAVVTVAGTTVVPHLLRRLPFAELDAQSRRWAAVGALAASGDVRTAVDRMKTPPRRGRTRRAMRAGGPVSGILRRDLRGLGRAPGRTAAGLVITAAAAAAIGLVSGRGEGVQLPLAVAALALYFSVGMLADGLRAFTASIGGASPYGIPPQRQARAHLLVPASFGVLAAVVGAAVATAWGGSIAAAAWSALVVLFAVVMQLFAGAKGQLPVALLMPVPTPVGDLSVLGVLLWLADAIVITGLVAGGLTGGLAVSGPGFWDVALLLLATGAIWLWASGRLNKLTRP